jgi:hypothetical protein
MLHEIFYFKVKVNVFSNSESEVNFGDPDADVT